MGEIVEAPEINFYRNPLIIRTNDELDDENFIQINSGCIVNVKYIEEYEECNIKLDNGKKLAVSRSRMKKIKELLNKYWRNRV